MPSADNVQPSPTPLPAFKGLRTMLETVSLVQQTTAVAERTRVRVGWRVQAATGVGRDVGVKPAGRLGAAATAPGVGEGGNNQGDGGRGGCNSAGGGDRAYTTNGVSDECRAYSSLRVCDHAAKTRFESRHVHTGGAYFQGEVVKRDPGGGRWKGSLRPKFGDVGSVERRGQRGERVQETVNTSFTNMWSGSDEVWDWRTAP